MSVSYHLQLLTSRYSWSYVHLHVPVRTIRRRQVLSVVFQVLSCYCAVEHLCASCQTTALSLGTEACLGAHLAQLDLAVQAVAALRADALRAVHLW